MQSRPRALARYSAASALLTQSDTEAMPGWHSDRPMLTVQRRPRVEKAKATTYRRSRSAATMASSQRVSGMTTPNSSPP